MTFDAPTRPIRVLHVIETLGTGGMENGVVNLVNGHNPDIVSADVLCTRDLGDFAGRISPEKLHFDRSAGSGITSAIRTVSRLCREERFDVVHSHSWATLMPGFFGANLSRTPRFVHGEHGTLYLDRFRRRVMQRAIFNRADRCLTVSNSLMTEIMEKLGISASKFSVIGNGVDVSRFRPVSEWRGRLLHTIGAAGNAVVIGSVGRLVSVKDYPTLLRAFAMLCDSIEEPCHLVLVGDGPQRGHLQELAHDLEVADQVHFLGESAAVEELLPAFDIFVLPSIHEGMSNTLLEAAACGVVAIASDIAPNREVVVEGNTGLFFEVGNPDSLCECLTFLASNGAQRQTMSTAAVSLARQDLSIESMIRNYEKLYCSLVDVPASGDA